MKIRRQWTAMVLSCLGAGAFASVASSTTSGAPADGSVLPFPAGPSASIAEPRLQDSVHKRRAEAQHLKPGAPNVLIILLDDIGFRHASTFDVGVDLGSTVSVDYFDRRPFAFDGKINASR